MSAQTDMIKLEALGGMVDETDMQMGPTPEQAEQLSKEAEEAAEVEAWAQIPMMLGDALSMWIPAAKFVYTEEKCMAWGKKVVPVANKRGWNGPGSVPEVGLAMATLGLVAPTVMLVRMKLTEERAEAEKAEKLATMRQGAATATDVDPMREVKQGATGGPAGPVEGADHGQ